MTWLLTALVFVLMVSVLVAAHEYGHFLFARICGMDVEEFSIGMWRLVWRIGHKKGTDYNLRVLPIGGYVRIKGMIPQEDGGEVEIPNGFYSKSPYKRFIVLLAGPTFSILAGVIILIAVYMTQGEPTKLPVMGQLVDGPSPARSADIRPGDVIESIDGKPMATFADVHEFIYNKANTPLKVVLKRGNQILTKMVTPALSTGPTPVLDKDGVPTGAKEVQAFIGVRPSDKLVQPRFDRAFEDALDAPIVMFRGLVTMAAHPKSISDQAGGPVTIVADTKEAVSAGFYVVLVWAAILSMNLGFMNLLPIVPLDGGQMLVAVVEMFKRRRLSMKTQGIVSSVGLSLMAVMILGVFWADVKRLVEPKPEAPKLTLTQSPAPKPLPTKMPAKRP